MVAFFSARPTYPILMVSGSALASAAVRRKTSATATNARIKALLDVFASVILCNTYCFEHVAQIERSEIRKRQCLTANVVPHFAEFIIGLAQGRTRWLNAGYGDYRWRPVEY